MPLGWLTRTGQRDGIRFEGRDGWIWVNRTPIDAGDPDILETPLGDSAVRLEVSGDHMGNYPERGEYNKENDPESLTYILDHTDVPFEIVTVRYGKPTGTDAVRATPEEIRARMPGRGPRISPPVIGREGGSHETFGDYSVALFEHIDLHGAPPSRALFDMAAVAIVKNPEWATARRIPAPRLESDRWIDRPDHPRTVVVWENFDGAGIMEDFELAR